MTPTAVQELAIIHATRPVQTNDERAAFLTAWRACLPVVPSVCGRLYPPGNMLFLRTPYSHGSHWRRCKRTRQAIELDVEVLT